MDSYIKQRERNTSPSRENVDTHWTGLDWTASVFLETTSQNGSLREMVHRRDWIEQD